MTSQHHDIQAAGGALDGGISRRTLLRRAAAFGAAAPFVAGLLAACGGSSSSTATSAGNTSGGTTTTSASPSATTSGGGASPVASASPSGGSTGTGTGTTYTIEPAKNKGGKLIYGLVSDAKTANPVIVTDGPSNSIIAMMFNAVIQTNPETTEPLGDLGKSWEISDDGITYSFTLEDGVKWHDGEPMTANDVKFTYELMLNKDSKSSFTSQLASRIASIDVADDTNFSVTLKSPNAAFLISDMNHQIVPQHILKDVAPADLAQHEFSTGKKGVTIGTGPFVFEEWVKDDHVLMLKNADYFRGEPNLDQWIMKVVPNQTVLVQQLKTGEVDFGAIQPADVEDMKKETEVAVHTYETFGFTFYGYNLDATKTPLFQEKEVRQALLYALDRKAMADAVYFGLATVAVGTMPVLSWAYDPDAIKLKYEYDPDKAKSMLDAAGWKAGSDGIREKDGKKLAFQLWVGSISQAYIDLTSVMQQQWKQIGVDCTPQTQEWNAFLTRITGTFDYETFLVGFGWPSPDPDQSLMWPCSAYKAGFNLTKYCNPQVDKLLEEGLATTDRNKRKEIYNEMQNILMEDLPEAILFFPQGVAGVNKRVHNLFPNAANLTFDSHQWWVDAS